MRWSASIVLSLTTVGISWGAGSPPPTTPPPDAQNVYQNYVKPYSGSPSAVQQNLVAPLVKARQMKTLDGQKQFSPSSFKASGNPVLRVSTLLNVSSGDVAGITVEQDLAGSGSINSASMFPYDGNGKQITSICDNGYIQCDPATFSGCQYREWTVNSSGKVGAQIAGSGGSGNEVGSITALNSCYCFNRACSKNNSAVLNVDTIAADAAAGVLSAFLAARKDFVITGATNAGSGIITYFGVPTSGAMDGADTSKMTPQSAAHMPIMSSPDTESLQGYYLSSPTVIETQGSNALEAQKSAPNSIFNVVNNSMSQQTGQKFACTNQRIVSLDLNEYSQSSQGGWDGSIQKCTDHLMYAVLYPTSDKTFSFGEIDTSGSGLSRMGANCGPVPDTTELGGYGHLLGSLTVVPPQNSHGFKITHVDYILQGWGNGCSNGGVSITWTPSTTQGQLVSKLSLICSAEGAQSPSVAYAVSAVFESQDEADSTTNDCAQYETDTTCKLQQESWDGRPVVNNSVPTGFRLYQICKDIPGPLRNAHICRDWWKQDKTYICTRAQRSYDFSQTQQRIKRVQDSTSMPNDRTMSYTDNGQSYTYGVFPKGNLPGCQQVCKTKIPAPQSKATNIAVKSSGQSTSGVKDTSFLFYYKSCVEGGGTPTCPVDTNVGEVIVSDCSCSGDVGDAIGAISVINGAAQDMICAPN